MGCSFETAKQRNSCSINSSSKNRNSKRSRIVNSTNKLRHRAHSLDNQIISSFRKTLRRQSFNYGESSTTSENDKQVSSTYKLVQSESDFVLHHSGNLSSYNVSRRYKHNCHCPLTTATLSHKINNNHSCPSPIPQIGKSNSNLTTTLPLVTAANLSINPATKTTTTLPNKPQQKATSTRTTTTTDSATTLPPKYVEEPKELFSDGRHYQEQQQQQQQQLKFDRSQELPAPSDSCLHSYTNATTVTRGMAAALAAACASSSCTVHEMLSYARDVLTARLSNVSNKLMDNISYYADAAAVATTTRCTKASQKRQMKKKKKKYQKKCHQYHCNRHYYERNTSLKSSISETSLATTTDANGKSDHTKATTTLLTSSPTITCSNCNIVSSMRSSQSSTVSVSASATGTGTGTTTGTSSTAPQNESNTAAAAVAYNYIGNNYYHLLRNTISFYAASSVILVLCYLTTTTSAAAANSEAAPHPIVNFDWSKFDESSSDKEILDMLLEKKRYDKRLLPPVNDEDFCCGLSSPDMAINQNTRRPHNRGTLTVNVNVLLLSLASPDESSLKYEVEFLLNQQWSDPRLQYGNKSHYDFLNALHHHDSIWTPDTYFIMHGDFKDPIIPMHFALRIYRNGTITYAMRRHLILSCQGSLHIFPFDDPKCSFSMESISYEVAQIKYVWKNDEDTLRKSPSLTSLNAYLIKNQTTACEQTSWRGNYSCLRVDLIFTRDRAFYFTTVFIPGIILVTSSFITFWLEWNAVPARSMIGNYSCLQVALTFTRDRAYYFTTVFIPGIILVTSSFITFWLEWNAVPARVMIGVTTMLNFFTTSNGFRSTLPVVSNLTAMNVWDGVCMCFIYASLLEFVCVNYVGRKRPLHNVVYRPGENPVTQRLPAVLSRIGVILASPLAAAGLSSAGTTMPQTPTSTTSHIHWERHYGGGMIGAAVKNLRARSLRRRCDKHHTHSHSHSHSHSHEKRPISRRKMSKEHTESDDIYAETVFSMAEPSRKSLAKTQTSTTVTVENDLSNEMKTFSIKSDNENVTDDRNIEVHIYNEPTDDMNVSHRKRSHSIATNTPPLVIHSASVENTQVDIHVDTSTYHNGVYSGKMDGRRKRRPSSLDLEAIEHGVGLRVGPVRPPRKKTSRSTSPAGAIYDLTVEKSSSGTSGGIIGGGGGDGGGDGSGHVATSEHVRFATNSENGEKRRDAGAPNEIVACTTCGGSSSPCTHSANNGCATETCFVQVRKKEPPHPIRVAKTIDVIARITFPTAYAIFLIFFFVHYKGFS